MNGSKAPIEPLTTHRYRLRRSTRLHSGLVFSPRHEKAPVWRLHFLLQYGGSSELLADRFDKRLRDTDCMALHWHIESREKLFVVIADGNVELEEAEQMLDAVVCSGATGYRKLFDGMLGETRMTPSELLTLGVRIRALHAGDTPFGPVAIALPHDKRPPLMRLMGIMAAARRPLRIFNDVESAHGWLSLFDGSGRDDLKQTESGSTFHRTLQRAGGVMKRRAASVTSRN